MVKPLTQVIDPKELNLIHLHHFRHADTYLSRDRPDVAIAVATSGYIPQHEFQQIFTALGETIEENNITKMIFDKTQLTVFHQPSMEWYFLEWKEQMFDLGLKTHRKILPPDEVFRESVKMAREKLERNYPMGKFKLMDIRYANSIEEALDM